MTITGRNRENLTKVANKIKTVSNGHVPLQLIGDLLDPATATMLVKETIAKFGHLNILICNAGGMLFNVKYCSNINQNDYLCTKQALLLMGICLTGERTC